jgi:predicted RecB family nuclease
MPEIPSRQRLSKSRFVAGVQCHRLLWWKVHTPDAEELQPDKVLQDLFSQGQHVGEVAREGFPRGVLIDGDYRDYENKLAETQKALASDAPAIFEASFVAHNTFVAVDILERAGDGFNLIEVKSSSSQKDEHIPDAAVQKYVLEQNGIRVERVEIMHLNREHLFPDTNDLFARTDVTTAVDEFIGNVPGEIDRQLEALNGMLPDVGIGTHCFEPRECPFLNRCWPQSRDHIIKLYNVGPKKAWDYMRRGIHWIPDLPEKEKLPAAGKRQVEAMRENRLIVEPSLGKALEDFNETLGFLDFETVSRAIPVWPKTGPWKMSTAQFSYHEEGSGGYTHVGYLAEGPHDARPALAERLLDVTKGASKIVMYSSFERRMIRDLQAAVPDLERELKELEDKLVDLLPVIRNNVYHPRFEGSFSLKYVLSPMVPGLTYNDLVIVDGMVASVEIARLLFVAHKIPEHERDRTRKDLLDYCERDTWALVRLLARLRELAAT